MTKEQGLDVKSVLAGCGIKLFQFAALCQMNNTIMSQLLRGKANDDVREKRIAVEIAKLKNKTAEVLNV